MPLGRPTFTPSGVHSTQRDVQFVTRPNAPVWDAQNFFIDPTKPGVQLA